MNVSEERKRNRRMLTGATVLLLVSVGIFGSVFWLRSRAVTENAQGHRPWQPPAPELVRAKGIEKLEKAKFLREKWRVAWAEKHKKELRAMLAAKPDDQAALMAVVNAIPNVANRETTGFDGRDLMPSTDLSDPAVVTASWTVRRGGTVANPNDPTLVKQLEEHHRMLRVRTQEDFAAQRDVVISQVFGVSSKNDVYLWASGRITQKPITPQRVPGSPKDKPRYVWPEHKQIVPPYEFLQKEKTG